MHSTRFFSPLAVGDFPLITAPPAPPETSCEMDWPESWGSVPAIRLQPSHSLAGSSLETDRIIHRWGARIFNLVEQTNSMARDLAGRSWHEHQEHYYSCYFLKLLEPVGRDMRRFTDEACYLLMRALASDEIMEEVFWPFERTFDARDIREWLQRWGAWLPDGEGQFRLWSVFMDCEAIEALYRYVHALLHDYYLEILELHMEWEEKREQAIANGAALPEIDNGPPDRIIYYHPRLILGEVEYTLNSDNAEEFRDWAFGAFINWERRVDDTRKEALMEAAIAADELCPDPRWRD